MTVDGVLGRSGTRWAARVRHRPWSTHDCLRGEAAAATEGPNSVASDEREQSGFVPPERLLLWPKQEPWAWAFRENEAFHLSPSARRAAFRLGRRTPLVGPNPPASAGIRGYLGRWHGPQLAAAFTRNASKLGPFC